jgi:hypothetical protein
MDLPVCIGCGKTFPAQKSLSAHAARCAKNKSLTLADPVQRNKTKCGSDKSHHKKSKRARSEHAEVIQDGIDVNQQMDFRGMDVDHNIFEQVSHNEKSIRTTLTTFNLLRSRMLQDHQISHIHPDLPQSLQSALDMQYACLGASSTTSLDQPPTLHICLPLAGSNEVVFHTKIDLKLFEHHLHLQPLLLSQRILALHSSLSRPNPMLWVFIANIPCVQL